ncbi:MAG: hypothetical protein ACW98D_07020 [Promethearchaeota archaeon]|jgi:hypothetical protein
MAVDITSIIILVAFLIIFAVFLVFDLFGRNEKGAYLAYIVALLPANYYWGLELDPLIAYIILFILWDITLLRDTIGIYRKKEKEINETLLYLFLGIIIQLIVTAIMPGVNENLKVSTDQLWYFWLPNVHTHAIPAVALAFRIIATLMVLLVIFPLILDIRDEEASLPILIIFVVIFILPFLYLSFIWVPEAMGVLTFLFSVILFVILLLITRSGKETK